MKVLKMRVPLLRQLHVEEALLRRDTRFNWLVLNRPPETEPPTIVLGISGKPTKLTHLDAVRRDGVPMVKRFSGGGTVLVDGNTSLVSLICNQHDVAGVQPFPRRIMDWSERVYARVFREAGVGAFELRENDYCIGEKKIGGNAQAIIRNRWLHHTSFLWRANVDAIEKYLSMPDKVPDYREGRGHTDFITSFEHVFPSVEGFELAVQSAVGELFDTEDAEVERDVLPLLEEGLDGLRTVVLDENGEAPAKKKRRKKKEG